MIEDEELRMTFKIASEEHLHKLDEGLLYLEKQLKEGKNTNLDTDSRVQDMMREAHSLKGDAGMLGVKDVATLSHQWEHLLGSVKRGESPLSAEICDRLYHGLDAIRKLVQESVTGTPSGINTFYILAHLMGAPQKPAASSPPPDSGNNLLNHLPTEDAPTMAPPPNSTAAVASEAPITEVSPISAPLGDSPPPLEQIDQDSRGGNIHLTVGAGAEPTPAVSGGEQGRGAASPAPPPEVSPPSRPPVWAGSNRHTVSPAPGVPAGAGNGQGEPPRRAVTVSSGFDGAESTPAKSQTLPVANLSSGDTPVAVDSEYRIETIRVETSKLDALMTQTGELTVTKSRISHRLADVEEILNLCEEWSRDAFMNRFFIEEITQGYGRSSGNGHVNGEVTGYADFAIANTNLLLAPNGNGHKFNGGQAKASNDLRFGQLQEFHHRTEERLGYLLELITRLRNSVYEDSARLDIITDELEEGVRTLRLLPLSTIFNMFPRMVRDLAKQQAKQVELMIEGGETRADKRILEEMKDPLMHMIRNAVDHGIETPAERERRGKPPGATIRLLGYQTASNVIIEVVDDGCGLDIDKIKETALRRGIAREDELAIMTVNQIYSLIFAPGFSTRTFVTEVSGRGVGLDVVRTNVERLKGSIHVESTPGKGCTLRIQLPTTLATAHVLLIAVDGITYALPVEFVQMARLLPQEEIFCIEGRETILLEGQPISVIPLGDLLQLSPRQKALSLVKQTSSKTEEQGKTALREAGDQETSSPFSKKGGKGGETGKLDSNSREVSPNSGSVARPCIICQVGDESIGLIVDALLDEQDVVLKPQSKLLQRVRNVSGATILGTGEVCMVLNPQDLLKSVRKAHTPVASSDPVADSIDRKKVILLVEDSIATRTQEKRILEAAGYEVVTAVDGMDGFNKLQSRTFDAVISDVQMPNLDGLGLTAKIRQIKEYSDLPIILVTSLAKDEDKRRGAEAGANAYITKSSFNQTLLTETLRRLIF
nr:hybrid sensor histidine kinase/response regulator [[Phormidium] sp. ETS-05]